jgi:hypothetical protein
MKNGGVTMKNLKVGDWVYYAGDNERLEGALGFIVQGTGFHFNVEFIQDYKGKRIKRQRYCHVEELIPASVIQPPNETQLETLINLALDTGDKDWFMELTEQYKRRNKNDWLTKATIRVEL